MIRYDTILYENDTIAEAVQKIRYDTKIYEFNTITKIWEEIKLWTAQVTLAPSKLCLCHTTRGWVFL